MTDADIRSVLAQMARAGGAASETGVVTPARALRLSLARAVEGAAGLKVTVLAVSHEPGILDDVVASVGADDLVLGLEGAGGLIGVAVLDRELRSAFVEAQTMGRLSSMPAPDRPVSVADAALATPVVDAFLVELAMAAAPTVLDRWTAGVASGGRIDGARGVGLKLAEDTYRIATMSVDLGIAEREGRLIVALPLSRAPKPVQPERSAWSTDMEKAVLGSSAVLTAVLHRFDLSLERAEALKVGDVVPLLGAGLGSLRLEAEGGHLAGHARLGQMQGMKAVRVGPPEVPQMVEAAAVPGAMALMAPDAFGGADLADASAWAEDQAPAHAGADHAEGGYGTAATAAPDQPFEQDFATQPLDPGDYAQPDAPGGEGYAATTPEEYPPADGTEAAWPAADGAQAAWSAEEGGEPNYGYDPAPQG